MKQNLTTGSVPKTVLVFALPYLLSYFLQTLYGMADLFITGQFYGVDSITAVANGSQVMHMITVMQPLSLDVLSAETGWMRQEKPLEIR